ncbi:uncharacterized protein LOC134223031 [Armigeres subalbatus]|uniref:uncharacterized protein LOC134223031 n=1 Tax=Armigeres subalbatus TaxID=124917 RepID=UPI002ED52964
MKLILFLVLIATYEVASFTINEANDSVVYSQNATNAEKTLSRAKRFLLFPKSALALVTIAAAKILIFRYPATSFGLIEWDLLYPLPDYTNRISQFKLGEIFMKAKGPVLPPPTAPKPTTTSKPPAPAVPLKYSHHEHHLGHEVSEMELQSYLKDHPETWVPPGYGKDRSDWFASNSYNPYQQPGISPIYESYKRRDQTNFNRKAAAVDDSNGNGFIEEEDRFNISQHRDWENFYHYRERRDLYHTIEHILGHSHRLQMKSCVLRAICEARNLLLPQGKSMMVDIVRLVFSVPLKDDLQDDYSKAMRHENSNCAAVYGEKCAISILALVLFGKFEPSND